MARELKRVIIEGSESEITLEVVSSELIDPKTDKPTLDDAFILKLHKSLSKGAKVVLKPAKEYKQNF